MNQVNIRNFCIIAHIDHGKSTLADRMLELTNTVEKQKMKSQYLDQMDLERERGITIKLQPVRMFWKDNNNTEFIFNLIDTPGHVDFSYEVSRSLAACEGAILLVDATKGIQAQTLANLYQAIDQNLDIIPVVNKIDLPNAEVEETKEEIRKLLGTNKEDILEISAKTGENVEDIFPEIVKNIREPQVDTEKPLKALIFDSIYDDYRGVVAYVKVVDGKINPGEKIHLMASGDDDLAIEVGYFSPQYIKKENLYSGEIGYIITGFKDVSSCRVGDTIISSKFKVQSDKLGKEIKPLIGYKKVKPMVFAQFYSRDGEVDKLRDALEKLSLNDSALSFEATNSRVFGMGFECGFLGLLHLEIIKERLLREYNLDLIITSPRVDYKVKNIGNKMVYSEPWVKLEVITPQEYIGSIMDITIKARGKYKSTEHIGDRVVITFEAPLANIVTSYYDRLKSVSAGYASLNYDLMDYREEDLVKMNILIAGDNYENLSQIVHRNELMSRAKNMVKKLKDLLPKQTFKVIIQAACGGKIIARENLGALKKDVTGHLYGGDISRKKKLLKKQAEGKKRMQMMGKVDIPTDVFIKLLK